MYWVQGVLEEAGYDPGKRDGMMGPRTEDALKRFQRDQDLPKTGMIDWATKSALRRLSPVMPDYMEPQNTQEQTPTDEYPPPFESSQPEGGLETAPKGGIVY